MKYGLLVGIAFLIVSIIVVGAVTAKTGEEIFSEKCSGCHTIGGGDVAGPDLAGVTERRDKEWLIRIITEPDKLASENDPIMQELIAKYGFQMPNLGVTREEAELIIDFLSQFSGEGKPSETATPTATATPEETPQPIAGDPVVGKKLFLGEERFQNGGPPCISCHSVRNAGINGGTLAKDLSGLYSRLGERGLQGALKSLQFPVMKDVFAGKSLTDDEIADLIAFFRETEQGSPKADQYPLSGFAVFLIAIIVAGVYYGRVK